MLDIMIILFIAIGIFIGKHKGFVRTVYEMGSTLLALVLAFLIYPVVKWVLYVTPLDEWIQNWNMERFSSMSVITGLQSQGAAIKEMTDWLPDFIGDGLINNNNPEIYEMMGVHNVVEYVSSYITDLAMSALAIVVAWIGIKLILSVVVKTLDFIAKLPLLKTVNQTFGMLVGGAKNLIIIWIVCLVVPFILLVPQWSIVGELLDQSLLTKWLYENNILILILNQIFLG